MSNYKMFEDFFIMLVGLFYIRYNVFLALIILFSRKLRTVTANFADF